MIAQTVHDYSVCFMYVPLIREKKISKNVLNGVTDWGVVDREFILSDSASLSQNRKTVTPASQLRTSLPFRRAVPSLSPQPPLCHQPAQPSGSSWFLRSHFPQRTPWLLGLGHVLLQMSQRCVCFRNPSTAGPLHPGQLEEASNSETSPCQVFSSIPSHECTVLRSLPMQYCEFSPLRHFEPSLVTLHYVYLDMAMRSQPPLLCVLSLAVAAWASGCCSWRQVLSPG